MGSGFHHGFGKESRAITLQNGKYINDISQFHDASLTLLMLHMHISVCGDIILRTIHACMF